MEVWQLLLQKGNFHFNHENWYEAEECYQQAVECLEQFWLADIENSSLLLAWIGSFHNLAVLYEVQGKAQLAFKYLQIPHQRMMELSHNNDISQDLQLIALRAIKITLNPILAFSKKHKACAGCLESLKQMEAAANAQQPVLH